MFELAIPASATALKQIKAELNSKLPTIKSSHRCEALARGLGFRTYAAALAATHQQPTVTVQVYGNLFSAYLADHGFQVQASFLYDAVAKAALQNILDRTPILTVWGIGIGPFQRTGQGKWETTQERQARFRESRAAMTSDASCKSFLNALAFVARVKPTKTIRSGTGSYSLKHIAEAYKSTYPDGEKLGPIYVPNGILIAAALQAGFKMRTYVDDKGYYSINSNFNMSVPCLADLDCEIRPDGAEAQKRKWLEQRKMYRSTRIGLAGLN